MVVTQCAYISVCEFGLPPELTDQDHSTQVTLTHDAAISGGVTHINMNITNTCVESEFQVKVYLTDDVQCRESNLLVSQILVPLRAISFSSLRALPEGRMG